MADLVLTVTIDEDDVLTLAVSLGYYTDIPDPADPSSTITNTETKEDYLARWLEERWSADFRIYKEAEAIGDAPTTPLGIGIA